MADSKEDVQIVGGLALLVLLLIAWLLGRRD